VLGTPTTATSGRSAEFRKGSNPNPVEFVQDLLASGLLPTPNTMEHREIKTPAQIAELKLRSPGGYRNLRETVINELPEPELLRTPSVTDSTGGAISETQAKQRGRMVKVADQVAELAAVNGLQVSESIASSLLPTPAARDYKDGQAEHLRDGVVQTDTVARAVFNSGQVSATDWGKFEPAIRRWEELTRPAPSPTKPDGKDGNHRLSAEFTEWMMGLPAGWVTAEDIGLKRNDALKACGNGVVPQQAELALRILLQDLPFQSTLRGGQEHVLPTPTVMDQRDGKYLRTVAIKNLANGNNRGLNLNNVVEAVGVDWADGDTFEMIDGKLEKRTKPNGEKI